MTDGVFFGHSHKLLLNKFFDSDPPTMRKVATNVVACWLPERWPTATVVADAKISFISTNDMSTGNPKIFSMKDICICAVGQNTAQLQTSFFSDKEIFASMDPK